MAIAHEEYTVSYTKVDTALVFVFRILATLIAFVVLYVGAYLTIDVRNYIQVHSIVPSQSTFFIDEEVTFDVDSEVLLDYNGGYLVDVRERNSTRIFCTSGFVELNYRQRERTNRRWLIGNWAAGAGGCNNEDRLDKSKMPAGDYEMTTCHRVFRTFFPVVQRCWDPTFFSVVDPENPPEFIQRSLQPVQSQVETLQQEIQQLKAQ